MATVLFIDDQTSGSRHLIRGLRGAGHEVCVATDADEAIRLFRLFAVDVVVMDCRLCGLKHPFADPAAVLKRRSPDIPIIMMSDYCRVPCRRMLNADACIQKGEGGRHLLRVVELMSYARRYGLCRSVPA
jgi:CheY-like chemotaxis protein